MRVIAVVTAFILVAVACYAPHPALNVRKKSPAAAAASYTAPATLFGTNSWMERDGVLTGASNSKQGLLSIRYKFDATNGLVTLYDTAQDKVEVTLQVTGAMRVRCRNDAGTTVVQMDQDTVKVPRAVIGTWYHLLSSWDTTAGVVTGHLYLNNIEARLAGQTITADGIVACGTNDHSIGQAVGGGFVHPGCLSEVWITFGQFQDISSSGNRLKWGDGSDLPVSLGSDGSTPTGTAPFMYFKDSSAVAWTNNSGTGGFMFKKGGTAFSACSDHP